MSSKQTQEKPDKILSIIKSCISSAKQNLTIEQLHRDYKQLIGSPIPFKTFHHATLASFLQAYPQDIKVYNYGGELYVKSVSSADTKHMENLIRGQKSSKSKGSFYKPNTIRKPNQFVPFQRKPRNEAFQKSYLPNNNFNPYPSHRRLPMNYNHLPVHRPTHHGVTNKIPAHTEKMHHPLEQVANPSRASRSSAKTDLHKEAAKKGFSCSDFETVSCGKKSIYFISKVHVGGKLYSSYPEEKRTPKEAEEFVAKKALEALKEIPNVNLPQTGNEDLITQRIRQLLAKQKDSVWWTFLCNLYSKEFKESVPDNWITDASKQGIPGIDFNHVVGIKDWILSEKKDDTTSKPEAVTFQENIPKCSDAVSEHTEPLKYPKDSMWQVLITHLKDFSEVWFRLCGEEYSEKYESLVTEMELYYMEETNRSTVKDFKVDQLYACFHEESWYRAKLIQLEEDTASVFFIDHGDCETVAKEKLYQLKDDFLKLPAQSIKSSLVGLESGINDPSILSSAQNLVLGKPIIAEVVSREKPLSVILFDTSTEVDVNINEQLLEMLPEAYQPPKLPNEGEFCEVYVTHVASNGDISIKIESASFQVLESLLRIAKKRAAEILGDENITIDLEKLYLAKFSPDGEWYRSAPRSTNRNSSGKVLLRALDFGIQERVATANIVPMDKVSQVLCKIHPQSLTCRLHNVPSSSSLYWTQKTSERLISLLPKRDDPLLLKVMKGSEDNQVTQVELFKRVQPKNMLVSINTTLDTDPSIFSTEDKNNNSSLENGRSSDSPSKEIELQIESFSMTLEDLASQELSPPPLPELNSYFDVLVTFAASPSHFAVQSWKNTMKLKWLIGEMKSFYSNSSNLKPLESFKKGGYYALNHTDGLWHRVRVVETMGDLVSGVFSDYGSCFCSNKENVQPLWPMFKQFSYQAFKAQLSGIIPIYKDWMAEDSCRFRALVENRAFVSIVTRIAHAERPDPPVLILRLVDTQDPDVDVYIDEILIKENRAKRQHHDSASIP